MPYEWLPPTPDTPPNAVARLQLWPYRSLPRKGFVLFIGATCALIAVPMLSVLGSPVLWGILPFFALAIWGMWAALSRSYRDAEIVEDLTLTRDALSLTRLHRDGGPVPHYLTLKGDGREVELGAFLSEAERIALHDELADRLARLR